MKRLALVLALLPACGGADPKALTDAGAARLNTGDASGAVAKLDLALTRMAPGDPDFLRASLLLCQALAQTSPERAQEQFLLLARAQVDVVKEADYALVADEMLRAGAIEPAAAIAEAGLKRFADSTAMKALRDRVGDAALRSGDRRSLENLRGLGYAGEDG